MKNNLFLEIANNQVGVKEIPVNQVKYNDWYYDRHVSGSSYPWCVVFVCWVASQCNVLGSLIPRTASSSAMYRWFKKNTNITMQPLPGYIGFVKNTGSNKASYPAEHTFIVYEVNGDTITTIEGNIDNRVVKQKRKIDDKILGFGVVNWDYSTVYKYVDNVDYEGLNVRYVSNGAKTGKVLQQATRVEVFKEDGNKAYISNTTYVDKNYLVNKVPPYKVVSNAKGGLNVRSKANILGRKLATLPNGNRVKVYQVKGNWSRVSPGSAWCYSKYLK